jgi:membrane-bound lytic murein transglycosylase B
VNIFQKSMAAALLATCALQAGAVVKKPTHKPKLSKRHLAAAMPSKTAGPAYSTRSEVMQEADAIAARLGLDPTWVRHAIGAAHFMPGVAKAILPPPVGVPKNWTVYQGRFVEPLRIKAGSQFWLANRDALQRAEVETGVPASIIVGIIGVETIYGQNTGTFRVIDALSTLSFDFPASHPKAETRTAFFRGELEAYLALTARTHTDPLALRGSYAGAMGWPQFMPSSWVKYAIDFDGDGRTDLFNSPADVIGSVANYFKAFGWKPGMPTHYPVRIDDATFDKVALLIPDILPTFTVAELEAKGVLLDEPGNQHAGPLALIELQNGDEAPQYVAGTENFYTITRYNWSSYYAMAVIELGQAVADALGSQAQSASSMTK